MDSAILCVMVTIDLQHPQLSFLGSLNQTNALTPLLTYCSFKFFAMRDHGTPRGNRRTDGTKLLPILQIPGAEHRLWPSLAVMLDRRIVGYRMLAADQHQECKQQAPRRHASAEFRQPLSPEFSSAPMQWSS